MGKLGATPQDATTIMVDFAALDGGWSSLNEFKHTSIPR